MLAFAQFIQSTAFFTSLRGSGYVYPIVLSLHMVMIAFFGGMILMTDMRLLGLAMRSYPVSDLIDQLRVPKRIGLTLMVTLGILMACCKAEEYYYNDWFRLKMVLLLVVALHALIFRPTVYNRAAELDRSPQLPVGAKLAGAVSLLLWIGIACAGRGIGYIEPPLDKIHAQHFTGSRAGVRHSGISVTFQASYDNTTKVVSALTIAGLAIAIYASHNVFVAWAGVAVMVLGYAFSPRRYEVAGRTIVVKRLMDEVSVPLENLQEVRRATAEDLKGGIRLWGSGGLFGYYGIFRTTKLGRCRWYVTNRATMVVVITASKTTLYSPDDIERFIAAVRG